MTAPEFTSSQTIESIATPETYETVYCTKYALSKGIFKVTGKATVDGYFSEKPYKAAYPTLFLGRGDWHRSWVEAAADAERRLGRKIDSLKRKIVELNQLKFVEVDRP
jgi:hypothetical protein